MDSDPVTIADLVEADERISAHCRACSHWKVLDPADLPSKLRPRPLPSLAGAFRCSFCGSRSTCAMPIYRSQRRPPGPAGKGWIMPPAE